MKSVVSPGCCGSLFGRLIVTEVYAGGDDTCADVDMIDTDKTHTAIIEAQRRALGEFGARIALPRM